MINGKKLVLGIFALVVILSVATFALYLLTRQTDEADDSILVPNAVLVMRDSHARDFPGPVSLRHSKTSP